MNPLVDAYLELITAALDSSRVSYATFGMNDGGLSVEYGKTIIRIFPPDEDVPDHLEVVVHSFETKSIAEFYVSIDKLSIQELQPFLI